MIKIIKFNLKNNLWKKKCTLKNNYDKTLTQLVVLK